MDDPAITSEGLMEHVKGPDFPTGGFILGLSGIPSAYSSGRGSIMMRSRHHVEELPRGDRRSIAFLTEIPYQVLRSLPPPPTPRMPSSRRSGTGCRRSSRSSACSTVPSGSCHSSNRASSSVPCSCSIESLMRTVPRFFDLLDGLDDDDVLELVEAVCWLSRPPRAVRRS